MVLLQLTKRNTTRSVRITVHYKIIYADELGHDQLHRHLAKNSYIKEFMLYDMKSKPEYEANKFAAELLLDDDAVNEVLQMEYDFKIPAEHDSSFLGKN